jgi:aspartyl-tRNA(Asn)/glutamyl-tRNA(Gln) amidotransferase subunit C
MKVTEKEVSYVADLANLDLTAEERTRMVRDLNSILGFIDTLNELDTSNVAPMTQVMAATSSIAEKGSAQLAYARRTDERTPSLNHEAALQNAPEHNADFFKVPKVIER